MSGIPPDLPESFTTSLRHDLGAKSLWEFRLEAGVERDPSRPAPGKQVQKLDLRIQADSPVAFAPGIDPAESILLIENKSWCDRLTRRVYNQSITWVIDSMEDAAKGGGKPPQQPTLVFYTWKRPLALLKWLQASDIHPVDRGHGILEIPERFRCYLIYVPQLPDDFPLAVQLKLALGPKRAVKMAWIDEAVENYPDPAWKATLKVFMIMYGKEARDMVKTKLKKKGLTEEEAYDLFMKTHFLYLEGREEGIEAERNRSELKHVRSMASKGFTPGDIARILDMELDRVNDLLAAK